MNYYNVMGRRGIGYVIFVPTRSVNLIAAPNHCIFVEFNCIIMQLVKRACTGYNQDEGM